MHVCFECAMSAHEHKLASSAFPSTYPNVVQSSGLDLTNHWLHAAHIIMYHSTSLLCQTKLGS